MNRNLSKLELLETVSFLNNVLSNTRSPFPEVGIILGTGMGKMADELTDPVVISYADIPHFPVSTVESHSGKLLLGRFNNKPVMMMQGRFHYYEGYSMQQIAFPIRVMKLLGIKTLIIMNASGSVNPLISPGSIVIVRDHINLMGDNPLIGPNDEEIGPRFPDMSEPYNKDLGKLVKQIALDNKVDNLKEGILVSVSGPNLETAAEYRMFQRIGADIVSMSTVPEVITAVHAGIKVVCLSAVTDSCLPDALKPTELSEIIKTAQSVEPRLTILVSELLKQI